MSNERPCSTKGFWQYAWKFLSWNPAIADSGNVDTGRSDSTENLRECKFHGAYPDLPGRHDPPRGQGISIIPKNLVSGQNPAIEPHTGHTTTTLEHDLSDRGDHSHWQLQGARVFEKAHDFVLNHPIFNDDGNRSDQKAMDLLLEHSISGLEHDSSYRNDPPQCHPGTRLDICTSAQKWFHDLNREKRILWLHGPAAVGKSAIMQTLADIESDSPNSILGVAIFILRPKQLNDPLRFFTTIAFRLAVKYAPYRRYVVDILTRDPQLVVKKVAEQFKWFIVKPFAEQNLLQGHRDTVLVIIDGLDECDGVKAQRDLVSLIGRFAVEHPNSPLIWVIASRPEPQIKDAFSLLPRDPPPFWEVDLWVASTQARIDVEKFLRAKFREVLERYPLSFSTSNSLGPQWPPEADFLKVLNAASGHFGFATVLMNFILDEEYGNPVSQLKIVLDVINKAPLFETQSNPLALLDGLYAEILSAVPLNVLSVTKNLLAWSFGNYFYYFKNPSRSSRPNPSLLHISNLLGLSQADVYGALQKLHSILDIPSPENVNLETVLQPYHTSFSDYIASPTHSGHHHVPDISDQVLRGALRVLLESYSAQDFCFDPSKVTLSWPDDNTTMKSKRDFLFFSFKAVLFHLHGIVSSDDAFGDINTKLAAIFQNIDYRNIPGPISFESFGFSCLPESTFTVLEGWGIAQKFDPQRIEPDQCVKRNEEIKSFMLPPKYLFPLLSLNSWKDGSVRKIFKVDILESTHRPVCSYLLGKGSKSIVCVFERYAWWVILPYDQP